MPLALAIFNRQRGQAFQLARIRQLAEAATPACLAAIKSKNVPLARLREIEVSIMSDRSIAAVHDEFFQDPTATDVITFQHGELLLGAGIVSANARHYGHSPTDEAALCVIHGMLHLAGWDDLTKKDAIAMAKQQEHIFKMAREVVGSAR